jgi:signal transduction histidine kinase/CheY-like chemotaxis protein
MAAKRREAELLFLAEASRTLAEVLDVPDTLQRVAASAVPGFADWCLVDIQEADGSLKRVAVAHADPGKVQFARELSRRHPPNPAAPRGVWNVLRTGRPDLVAEVTQPILIDAVPAPELRQILTDLGLKSYIGVPLSVRGKTLGVMTFVTAESGRRYDVADLRLAEDLAHRAAVAIENARLYAELKEADQRKDEFLAMLSHELRNPLAPIRNALHLMKMPGADGEVVENARRITERQVQHMVHLVDDLLDVSRIMRGRIELRRKPADLAGVMRHAVETAQPAIDAQGQQLIVSLPNEPIMVEADATRLAQVVSNLLHNAAKFSSRAGRLWLTARGEGSDVAVSVKDEGSGIASDLLPHIFDLFVQGDRSLQRSQGGLGIGLTVVRKLVELHGGTITAHSEGPGRGSEFVVRLPSLEGTSKLAPAEPLAGPAQRVESRRILVVDDNVDAAESIAVLLRLWGHQAHLAHNGMDAIRLAEEFHPDVVLLDIGLPGMNGYDVAERLRGQPGLGPALLIAVTGYGQQEDRLRAGQAGFDHHLTKPVNLENLQHLLAAAPRLGHN